MPEFFIIGLCAFAAATLTLFSGFGLGTLLMPVVALFFSVEIAIAITAVVHLANNLFKVVLLGSKANLPVLLSFGLPAMLMALVGAWLLNSLTGDSIIFSYNLLDQVIAVSTVKLTIGLLILAFVLLELSPRLSAVQFDARYLPVGGFLSGFFGGLSGHQGALRSMFLVRSGLNKEQFVATSAVLAALVDISRLGIYSSDLAARSTTINWWLVGTACLAAFIGSYFGKKLLQNVTIRAVQLSVSALLVVIALGMISGLV